MYIERPHTKTKVKELIEEAKRVTSRNHILDDKGTLLKDTPEGLQPVNWKEYPLDTSERAILFLTGYLEGYGEGVISILNTQP